MKDICCYILFSAALNKFYTGICQDNLHDRILKHNNGYYGKNKYTSSTSDWILFLRIDVNDNSHSRRIELKIKAMKSAKYIQNLKKYPELLEKLIWETKST